MGRKRRISDIVLTACILISGGCISEKDGLDGTEHIDIRIDVSQPEYMTKAIIPDEDIIRSLNIVIFEEGVKEGHLYQPSLNTDKAQMEARLVKGHRYSFYALANCGGKIEADSIEDIHDLVYRQESRDGFPDGLPMAGVLEDVLIEDRNTTIRIPLVRAAAKVSLCIDRSRLSPGVEMYVKRVSIGNYPRYVSMFSPCRVSTSYDRFDLGYDLTASQCSSLNQTGREGRSGTASLYLLENMQGRISEGSRTDENLCSYIEIEIFYKSSDLISYDKNLIYRFFIGEDADDLNVERNCHYRITVTPEDDGLSGSGWRVDKSGIGPSTPFFTVSPGNYIEGRPGDTIEIRCDYYPRSAPFDPGYEELSYDKSRGIYDYSVDEKEKTITLYLKKKGTGIVFPSAGYPVYLSEMIIVVVGS